MTLCVVHFKYMNWKTIGVYAASLTAGVFAALCACLIENTGWPLFCFPILVCMTAEEVVRLPLRPASRSFYRTVGIFTVLVQPLFLARHSLVRDLTAILLTCGGSWTLLLVVVHAFILKR